MDPFCLWCGRKTSWDSGDECKDTSATLDHLNPKSLGGRNTEDNLVIACRECNNIRGNETDIDEILRRISAWQNHRQTFEVIEKGIKYVHLTIARNRITLKYPTGTGKRSSRRYKRYARAIATTLGEIRYTMRGRFDDNGIRMGDQARSRSVKYTYELLEKIAKLGR
jgi:hypothetical protein